MSLEPGAYVDRLQSCNRKLQPTVPPSIEVYWGCLWQKRWAQFEAGWIFRKCSLCCRSKWLFPEETVLPCVCWFHQKVPNKLSLFIYCSASAELGISCFQTFLFSFLTAPSEWCTTHGLHSLERQHRTAENKRAAAIATPKHQQPVQPVSSYCSSSVEVM